MTKGVDGKIGANTGYHLKSHNPHTQTGEAKFAQVHGHKIQKQNSEDQIGGKKSHPSAPTVQQKA